MVSRYFSGMGTTAGASAFVAFIGIISAGLSPTGTSDNLFLVTALSIAVQFLLSEKNVSHYSTGQKATKWSNKIEEGFSCVASWALFIPLLLPKREQESNLTNVCKKITPFLYFRGQKRCLWTPGNVLLVFYWHLLPLLFLDRDGERIYTKKIQKNFIPTHFRHRSPLYFNHRKHHN